MNEEGLEFRILGPLEARRGGVPVALGGPKQRALLALLLLHAREVVSTDRLVDELWGEQPPAKATHTVQVFVSRLRKALGAEALVTRAPGYLVTGGLDLDRFRKLVAQAQDRREPEAALRTLTEALALWRGPPLAEFAYEPFAARHLERLEEERLAALEERVELELELGRHSQLVGELEQLCATHPLRERPHGQLMLALYRSGRQSEALETYRQLRRRLDDQLGLQPGAELQSLERQILQQDASLGPTARRGLPEGTVTLFFTDIEGSTELLHEVGAERYAALLEEHRTVLRDAFAAEGGVEVDTQGDALFVAFTRAQAALTAAGAAQDALAKGRVRVRMGIHTGEPLVRSDSYVGLDVNRAARIMSAGHGGQVLVSQATRELVGSEFALRDLGAHRLKDLTEPQRLYQLGTADFPPVRSLNRTNLPIQPTPLLGREPELAGVAALLAEREARLVTLTGPGGTGKTRLALQAAAENVEQMPDGVFWVSLAAVPTPELVLPAVARALDVREVPGEALGETLGGYLSSRRLLLLLDNFEHVLEARSLLAELLAEAPEVRLLVTSRARLGLSAEHVYEVPPLAAEGASELFVERARQVGVEVEADTTVAAICERLDRLPLAIELAAARASLLEPQALLERLERRLPLLRGGAPDLPARQQTLHTAIAWSHDLLDEDERTLFRRLSVFAGSFTLESAEAVADAELWTLESLVAKSLVRRWGSGRLGLLETIREFAAEQLELAEEAAELRNEHASHYLEFALTLEPYLAAGDRRAACIDELGAELDNLRSALLHFEQKGSGEQLLRLATAMWRFWMAHGYFGAGRRWLERGLAAAEQPPATLRARALEGLGVMHLLAGESVEGDRWTREALAAFRSLEDGRGTAESLNNLGLAAIVSGDFDRGESLLRESLELARFSGEWPVAALALGNLAEAAIGRGDFEVALQLLDEVAEIDARTGDVGRAAMGSLTRGDVLLHQGRILEARLLFAAALAAADALPQREYVAVCLVGAARVVADEDQVLAAQLAGAADALVHTVGASWSTFPSTTREVRSDVVGRTGADLGSRAFEAAYAAGREMSLERAVAIARAALEP